MRDTELKPCPFCGGQCAQLVIDQGDKWAHYEPSCLEVRTGYNVSDNAPWIADAITAWNTRQPDSQVTALLEALRTIESQALCVALRHDAAEADDWLHDISNQASNALSAWEQSNG